MTFQRAHARRPTRRSRIISWNEFTRRDDKTPLSESAFRSSFFFFIEAITSVGNSRDTIPDDDDGRVDNHACPARKVSR